MFNRTPPYGTDRKDLKLLAKGQTDQLIHRDRDKCASDHCCKDYLILQTEEWKNYYASSTMKIAQAHDKAPRVFRSKTLPVILIPNPCASTVLQTSKAWSLVNQQRMLQKLIVQLRFSSPV